MSDLNRQSMIGLIHARQGGFVQFPLDDTLLERGDLPKGMLEIIADAISAGLVLYDAQDKILLATKRIQPLLNVDASVLVEGASLRELFCAYYESRKAADPEFIHHKRSRDKSEWISENLAAHWKERSETEDRLPGKRWLRFTRRRLPSGLGLCVVSDISEQKRSEYQWRIDIERVQVIEEMLDRLAFPITVTDQNQIYVGANKAACQFMQKSIDSVVGRSVTDLHVLSLATRIQADNARVLESGQPLNVPERIAMPSGDEQLFVTHKVRVGKPGMYYVLSCMQDITSFASIGSDGALSLPGHEQLEFVQSPANAGIKVEDTISEILRVLLVCSDVAMAQLAKTRLTICGMEADYVTSGAEARAVLDYCRKGTLWLDLVLVCEDVDTKIVAEIASIGLRAERVSMKEVEQSITDIVCTTLNVRCAQCRIAEPAKRKLKDCSLCEETFYQTKAIDVLVVEDNQINQVVFAQIFDSLKLRHRIVASGREVLSAVETHVPDIIFMDTTLPDMDGYAATRALRAAQQAGHLPHIPVVGVVALAFEGDRQKCFDSGMDEMLLKPLSPDLIEKLLQKFEINQSNDLKIKLS